MANRDLVCGVGWCSREVYIGGLCSGHRGQMKKGQPFTELRRYRVNGPHTCTVHAPGTATCYTAHDCRCAECRVADGKVRKRRIAKPPVLVEVVKVSGLLRELAVLGWLPDEVSEVAGISRRHLDLLRREEAPRIKLDTARRISAAHRKLTGLTPPQNKANARLKVALYAYQMGWAPNPLKPGVGTNRRLQALSALGWMDADIVEWSGMRPYRVCYLRFADQVTATDELTVNAVYDRLSMKLPPNDSPHRRRRSRAKGQGFHPPLAWDDDEIDDPDAVPQNPQPEKRRGWTKLHIEDVDWMVETNSTIDEVMMRTGVKRDGIMASCARHGRRDLIVKLTGVAA